MPQVAIEVAPPTERTRGLSTLFSLTMSSSKPHPSEVLAELWYTPQVRACTRPCGGTHLGAPSSVAVGVPATYAASLST